MSLTAACCAEYPAGTLEEDELPGGPDEVAAETLSFLLLEAAVGSLRFGLEPEILLSFGVFPSSLDDRSWGAVLCMSSVMCGDNGSQLKRHEHVPQRKI